MQVVQAEASVTVTWEACLVGTGWAEGLAEAEPGCVSVGVLFAVAGLAELVWGTLRFDCGQ